MASNNNKHYKHKLTTKWIVIQIFFKKLYQIAKNICEKYMFNERMLLKYVNKIFSYK